MAYEQKARTNRFGNPEILKTAYQKVDRKTGDVLPIFVTYLETAGGLIKVEISQRNKPTKRGGEAMWVKFTKQPKRSQQVAAKW